MPLDLREGLALRLLELVLRAAQLRRHAPQRLRVPHAQPRARLWTNIGPPGARSQARLRINRPAYRPIGPPRDKRGGPGGRRELRRGAAGARAARRAPRRARARGGRARLEGVPRATSTARRGEGGGGG